MQTNAAPIFDTVQLNRRTMGDAQLQVEVLALFVSEAERLMRQLEEAEEPQLKAERLRAVIALARGVGAARMAQAARLLETQIGAEAPDLAPLRAAATETLAYVHQTGA